MNIGNPFILGVNYWPRRKAMYWWNDFDPQEVRDEFAQIRELGLKVVRIFLLWDDFQPSPDAVSVEALAHLVTVADIAAENGLGLDVTFFTGHMSGPNWVPRWLLGGPRSPNQPWLREVVSAGQLTPEGYRNPFHDAVALQAERLLLRSVVRTLKDHPAIWLWNLGNEPDLFAWPETYQAGRAWVREMVETIRLSGGQQPVTCGLHAASLAQENGFRVDQVNAETDIAVMHAYPMYTDMARHPLDPDFVPIACALTAALSGKPVLMEEFGGCTMPPGEPSQVITWKTYGETRRQFMASEEDLAEFIRQTLPRLVEVGAVGAMIWCFADYATTLWDRPPCKEVHHERFFGLVRPDGSLKPHANVLREFAATNPTVQPIPEYARIQVDAQDFYRDPMQRLPELAQEYLAKREKTHL
ncbi:MAG: cellulase family glycosylhydrolase [Anaerolineales bacterium]|nr:cellulase family glycosylhydrolase [Anaerolineales bacterium]